MALLCVVVVIVVVVDDDDDDAHIHTDTHTLIHTAPVVGHHARAHIYTYTYTH